MDYTLNKKALEENGYSIIKSLYTESEIDQIATCIKHSQKKEESFLRTKDLFAIRQLNNVVPRLRELLFNVKLTNLLSELFDTKYFLTKAIYFDKPSTSNWFVGYHQDLSISVNKKIDIPGYTNWTFKRGQYGVQPPIEILQNTITLRVHLDETDKNNGALKVIPKSHLKNIYRPESIDWNIETEHVCVIEEGGVMLMKPLTLHASNKTTNGKRRRVIHLEFCNHELENSLNWQERFEL
ncbi:phytanoyl-CoA dioxygenase [Aquimarina sp. AD10]|uniref:phytanoyl-CoA dioxygenase family protein n=1 Tax=Aquimarina sp. AD10 TaxID=1714849 RepID=UPI000E534FE3|nr:phytanoyl-CoA dioxygenase family protein [Aquimarina sp. AD10]AXT61617.1 phytanoyl-CoA dioxygenase [Aquimarina sp. AD10]RKN01034.1 phytanoyl-CoA dioxygenase [Aquimarina sp. AD10]